MLGGTGVGSAEGSDVEKIKGTLDDFSAALDSAGASRRPECSQ